MSLKHIDPKTGMPPSSSPEEYKFIMETGQKSAAPGGKMGMIFIAVAALSLMIGLFITLTSNMSSADEEVATQLTAVAVKQNEIINIARDGTNNARTLASRNIASTTYVSMISQQSEFLTFVNAQGGKTRPQDLASRKDQENQQALIEAQQNNRYDEVFLELIDTQIIEYQQALERLFASTESRRTKEALSKYYLHASTLAGVDAIETPPEQQTQ
jgi:ribosomal protein L17